MRWRARVLQESTAVVAPVHRTAERMTVGAEAEPEIRHTDVAELGRAEADVRVEVASWDGRIACPGQA